MMTVILGRRCAGIRPICKCPLLPVLSVLCRSVSSTDHSIIWQNFVGCQDFQLFSAIWWRTWSCSWERKTIIIELLKTSIYSSEEHKDLEGEEGNGVGGLEVLCVGWGHGWNTDELRPHQLHAVKAGGKQGEIRLRDCPWLSKCNARLQSSGLMAEAGESFVCEDATQEYWWAEGAGGELRHLQQLQPRDVEYTCSGRKLWKGVGTKLLNGVKTLIWYQLRRVYMFTNRNKPFNGGL